MRMNLWRLEVLRLTRTHRWTILLGVYAFFAVTGPLMAAYFNELMAHFGGEVTVIAPDPRPVDGLGQFIGNAAQLGVLAVVVVAARALAFDARPEIAAFLRTRVERPSTLLLPRYFVVTVAAVLTLIVSTLIAWATTAALIGSLPVGPVVIGTLYGAVFLAFAVAVLAAVGGFVRSQAGAAFASLAVLLALPIVGMAPAVAQWLPSELLSAVLVMVEGAPASDFLRSLVVTLAATAALLAVATHRLGQREL
jgi:ABC-2 type transport system permease protein